MRIRARQLEQALELVADFQNSGIHLADVTFTGHSLRGGLATLAVFFSRPAITSVVAPFEYSARDDFDFEDGGSAPDNNFGLYRDAWQYGLDGGGFQQAAAMLAARDQSMPSSSNRMRSLQFIYEVKR